MDTNKVKFGTPTPVKLTEAGLKACAVDVVGYTWPAALQ